MRSVWLFFLDLPAIISKTEVTRREKKGFLYDVEGWRALLTTRTGLLTAVARVIGCELEVSKAWRKVFA